VLSYDASLSRAVLDDGEDTVLDARQAALERFKQGHEIPDREHMMLHENPYGFQIGECVVNQL
jgi:hypothetical protein